MAIQFRIRPLSPEDLEHLWTMDWDPLPRQLMTFYLLCTLAHPRYCSVAVNAQDRVVGVLLTMPDESGRWLYVNHLRIEPDCRGAGVGTALMKGLEAECRASGIGLIWLLTSSDVEPFYAALGYRRDASFMPPITRRLMVERRPQSLILSKEL